MQPLMHIMVSFLSDLIPPLSISSSSFALRSVVPFFLQLPLFIYLPVVFPTFSDAPSSSYPFPTISLFAPSSKISFCAHPSIRLALHPSARCPCSWLTGRFKPSCGWVRGLRGLMSPGSVRVSVYQQCDNAQRRELRLEQVPAVWPQGR